MGVTLSVQACRENARHARLQVASATVTGLKEVSPGLPKAFSLVGFTNGLLESIGSVLEQVAPADATVADALRPVSEKPSDANEPRDGVLYWQRCR